MLFSLINWIALVVYGYNIRKEIGGTGFESQRAYFINAIQFNKLISVHRIREILLYHQSRSGFESQWAHFYISISLIE